MNGITQINFFDLSKQVQRTFNTMYKAQVVRPMKVQVLHGISMAFNISVYILMIYVDMLFSLEILNRDYRSDTLITFGAIGICAFMLNNKLCDIWGLRNPLRHHKIKCYTSELSITDLGAQLTDSGSVSIYQPTCTAETIEDANEFFDDSFNHAHKVFVMEYVPSEFSCVGRVWHIVDPNLVDPIRIECKHIESEF